MSVLSSEPAPITGVDFFTEPLPGPRLHELLGRAREEAPVTRISLFGTDGFLVTRFDDLRAFFVAVDEFPPGPMYQFHTEPVVGRTFISMDGAEHDQYRQLATPAFRSRATQRFVDDELTPLAHEVLDQFASRGSGDLVAELTTVLPFWAISRNSAFPWAARNANDAGRSVCSAIPSILTVHCEPRRR